ncbi:MAG: hypothetical protein JWM16_3161 [Verrucomicrobiales bacterium]|nr:hypothetical protein [Verrucomicrobiales bacterium]
MHTLDKKQKFIELRANGQTLADIAQILQVAKTTVWRWNQEEEEHIRELQMITQEEVEKDWHKNRLQRLLDLQTCGSWIHEAMIDQFRERADKMCLKELLLFQNLLRAEVDTYRVKPLQRSGPDTNPKGGARASQTKTEQNGTISPENGTAAPASSPLRSEISDLRSPATHAAAPRITETEQNGTKRNSKWRRHLAVSSNFGSSTRTRNN